MRCPSGREDMLVSFRNEVARTGDNYCEALTKLNQLQKQFGLLSPAADQATAEECFADWLISSRKWKWTAQTFCSEAV